MASDDARRELAELQRRAYGADADIHSDPAALARLRVLEDAERARRHPAPPVEVPRAAPALAATGESHAVGERSATATETAPASPPPPALRWRWVAAAAVAVAVLAGGAAVVRALSPDTTGTPNASPAPTRTASSDTIVQAVDQLERYTGDPSTRVLFRIPLDNSFGRDSALSTDDEAPVLPTTAPATWVRAIGNYFTARVWIARTTAGESCMVVIVADSARHARCVVADMFEASTLLTRVPFAELDPKHRPPSMTAAQSLGFWWRPHGPLEVMVGPTG